MLKRNGRSVFQIRVTVIRLKQRIECLNSRHLLTHQMPVALRTKRGCPYQRNPDPDKANVQTGGIKNMTLNRTGNHPRTTLSLVQRYRPTLSAFVILPVTFYPAPLKPMQIGSVPREQPSPPSMLIPQHSSIPPTNRCKTNLHSLLNPSRLLWPDPGIRRAKDSPRERNAL